jgi:hypothetical protein
VTPATLIREAAAVALHHAIDEQDDTRTALARFVAGVLNDAATAIGDLDGVLVESVFAAELRVARVLVGVTA